MERPHSFWIGLAAFLVVASLAGHAARAQNPDQCVSAGGTAECTGPEVRPYTYALYAPGWGSGPLGSEESAMALLGTIETQAVGGSRRWISPQCRLLRPAPGSDKDVQKYSAAM
jgi:hypothetical protein